MIHTAEQKDFSAFGSQFINLVVDVFLQSSSMKFQIIIFLSLAGMVRSDTLIIEQYYFYSGIVILVISIIVLTDKVDEGENLSEHGVDELVTIPSSAENVADKILMMLARREL